jgi:ketosteroid isomerase-like protein
MRILLLILAFLCCALGVQGQDASQVNELNTQVWFPFKKAYEMRDWKAFNALHTDDVLRINDYGSRRGKEYKTAIQTNFSKPTTQRKTIDFSFEKRLVFDKVAYEIGFYRVRIFEGKQLVKTSFGRFHVVVVKRAGRWRIQQDWDSDTLLGMPVNEQQFLAATRLAER